VVAPHHAGVVDVSHVLRVPVPRPVNGLSKSRPSFFHSPRAAASQGGAGGCERPRAAEGAGAAGHAPRAATHAQQSTHVRTVEVERLKLRPVRVLHCVRALDVLELHTRGGRGGVRTQIVRHLAVCTPEAPRARARACLSSVQRLCNVCGLCLAQDTILKQPGKPFCFFLTVQFLTTRRPTSHGSSWL